MLAALVVLVASHAAVGDPGRGLAGVWELVEVHKGGQKMGTPGATLCLTGTEYLCAENAKRIAGVYRVDVSKRPHVVMFTAYNGDGRGRTEVMGLELAGGTLRLTMCPDGLEAVTAVFKRVTP
jgi:uncharacterized protein (TIGR03067 family)